MGRLWGDRVAQLDWLAVVLKATGQDSFGRMIGPSLVLCEGA